VPVTAQLGPGSDQVILIVLDLTGDLSLIDAAKTESSIYSYREDYTNSGVLARISPAWRLTLAVPCKIHYNVQIHLSAPRGDGDLRISWRTHFRPEEG
jgi:hypothetical protein